MKQITCPECGKELDQVNAYGEMKQKVEIDETGQCVSYGDIEAVDGATIEYECPHCATNISHLIKE